MTETHIIGSETVEAIVCGKRRHSVGSGFPDAPTKTYLAQRRPGSDWGDYTILMGGRIKKRQLMPPLEHRLPDLKCVVVGDDSVGKTSMLMGYATNRYPTQHVPSVFDNYAGSLKLAGRLIQMQIIDTQQYEDNPKFRHSLYSGTNIFVVCFSVIRPESLTHVEEVWLPEIRTYAPKTPFILVGAQADLRSAETILQMLSTTGQRPVTSAEGAAVARRTGAACYIETSPEVEKNVRKLINGAIASILKVKTPDSSACNVL